MNQVFKVWMTHKSLFRNQSRGGLYSNKVSIPRLITKLKIKKLCPTTSVDRIFRKEKSALYSVREILEVKEREKQNRRKENGTCGTLCIF